MTPNLNEATSLVNSIPLVKESIPVLMKLANGSNPNIPSYMALGRLQQIKAMIEHSQQPQMPQGTVKQNLERSVANMGMMNGRQQQMQQNMMQQGITAPGPAPEGVPQPAPMPQPEQMQQPQEVMAAHGGILHAQTDPDMFNFAPGGIVAFAKEGEVKDKDKEKSEQEKERQRAKDRAALLKYPALAADVALSPARGALNLLDATGIPNFSKKVINAIAGTDFEPYYGPGYDLLQYFNTSQKENVGTGAGPRASRFTTADDPRVKMSAVPTSNSAAPPVPAVAPPPPPALAPKPAAAPAAPAAPAAAPGAVPLTQQGIGAPDNIAQLKKYRDELTPDNEYIKGIGDKYDAAKLEAFDQQKEIDDTNALYKSLGIGTYGENRRKQMEQRAKEFEGNRMSKLDRLISLGTAFSRPGARAGDMGQRSVEMNEAERDARERFQTAQDALMNTVELADEAIRTGKATKIVATKEAYKKALQEYKMAGIKVAETQALAQGSRQKTGMDAATSLLSSEMQMQSDREKSRSMEQIAAANNVSAQAVANAYAGATRAGHNKPSEIKEFTEQYFAIIKSQGQPAADAWLAQQTKAREAFGAGKYAGQDTSLKNELAIKAVIDKRTEILTGRLDREKDPVKQAALKKQIGDIAKQVRDEIAANTGDVPPPNAVRQTKP